MCVSSTLCKLSVLCGHISRDLCDGHGSKRPNDVQQHDRSAAGERRSNLQMQRWVSDERVFLHPLHLGRLEPQSSHMRSVPLPSDSWSSKQNKYSTQWRKAAALTFLNLDAFLPGCPDPDPVSIPNGSRSPPRQQNLSFRLGQTLTYSCDALYKLQGVTQRTCQSTATWSGATPTCERERRHFFRSQQRAKKI